MKLNELSPAKDPAPLQNVLAEVSHPAPVKQRVVEQKGTTPAPAEVSVPAMKAVRCLCIVVCPSADSPIYSRKVLP